MTKYLLLRDNKESGPYTFDDLKAKGLKAYDLVWIEGKSAAWRYPSEVEELRSFAPAVEEQPFDRFYKKPSQENASVTPAVQLRSSSVLSGEPSAVPGKRIIYVTLPAGKGTPPATRELAPREAITVKAPAPVPSVTQSPYAPLYEPAAPATPLFAEAESAQAHNDYGAHVEIMPRSGKRGNRSRIWQPVAVVLCVLALLAAGIFIGLSINKDRLGFAQNIPAKKSPIIPPPGITHTDGNGSAASSTPALQASFTDTVSSTNSTGTTKLTATGTTTASPKKPAGVKEKSSPTQKLAAAPPIVKDSALVGLPVVHREASHRAEQPIDKVDKEVLRTNLSNLVSVGTNSYTVGTFGGISGVQLTVSNKSVYPLDLVVVEVQYIQANKKVFKTENLYFRGIGPGSALMQEAPNSSRGIKVQYKITLVNSKELGLSYSAL